MLQQGRAMNADQYAKYWQWSWSNQQSQQQLQQQLAQMQQQMTNQNQLIQWLQNRHVSNYVDYSQLINPPGEYHT